MFTEFLDAAKKWYVLNYMGFQADKMVSRSCTSVYCKCMYRLLIASSYVAPSFIAVLFDCWTK